MSAPASPSVGTDAGVDVFADVVGQEAAVDLLRHAVDHPVHAYLLVGPRGSGKRSLAAAFAAGLLSDGLDPAAARRAIDLALEERHPDQHVVARVGASISADQAGQIVTIASRTPTEGTRKVIVLDEFHLVSPGVGPRLLKTVEEPPEGTVFVVLADEVSADLVTIASRCVRVELGPVPESVIAETLVAEGVSVDVAAVASQSADGNLRRARVLATDPRVTLRRQLWREVPTRLDGTGAAVWAAVEGVLAAVEDSAAPLKARQAIEMAELEERIERYGERGSGRKELEDRHKRELRRHRIDELRVGLAELARLYRERLAEAADPAPLLSSLEAITTTNGGWVRNPNERLQLQALFLRLAPLAP